MGFTKRTHKPCLPHLLRKTVLAAHSQRKRIARLHTPQTPIPSSRHCAPTATQAGKHFFHPEEALPESNRKQRKPGNVGQDYRLIISVLSKVGTPPSIHAHIFAHSPAHTFAHKEAMCTQPSTYIK